MHSPFTLTLDSLGSDLTVLGFRGKEAANSPYRFEVKILCHGLVSQEGMLGGRACLSIAADRSTSPRLVHGIVTACELFTRRSDDRSVVRLRLEPTLAQLKHRSHWRVFHDRTVRSVVSELLDAVGIAFEWRVMGTEIPRAHRCQRGERDLAFLHRMLGDEGIFYWFEQKEVGEVVVFSDCVEMYPVLVGAAQLRHCGQDESSPAESRVLLGLSRNVRMRAAQQSVRLFDWHRPSLNRESCEATNSGLAGLQLQEHEHASEGLSSNPAPASRRLAEARLASDLGSGLTLYAHAAPGAFFQLTEHSENALNSDYVIGTAEHIGRAPKAGNADERSYECKLTLAPKTTKLLAPRTRDLIARGLETATVMGPVAEEIYTDEWGRVQIRFHWDTGMVGHPPVTAWVRVSQPWGGAGYGATFTPRVGNEVLVGYIDGDPDKPIIVGSVHNALSPPAPRFPHERTRNGITTRSSPNSGGGHMLMFEDKKGEELLEIRSCRTLTMTAAGDTVVTTGGRLDTTVSGERADVVGANSSSSVAGNAVTSVGGDRRVAINGEDHIHVVRNAALEIGGNQTEYIAGNAVTLVQGSRQSFVGVGAGEPGHESLVVSGSYNVGASKGIIMQSPTAIEFRVGESRISLLPDRILLEGPLIQLQATDAVKLVQGVEQASSSLVLDGSASLSGGSATVSSGQGGILALDSEAKLNGALVKLNCSDASGGGAERIIDVSQSGTATFKVLPHGLPPNAQSVTLLVRTPAGELEEHSCTVGGSVTLQGHPGESFALVEMRLGETVLSHAEVVRKEESRG